MEALTGHLIYININLRLSLIKCIIVICKFDNEGFFGQNDILLTEQTTTHVVHDLYLRLL